MAGYIQRYPFAPKAVWWKRFNDVDNLNIKDRQIKNIERNKYVRQFSFDCTRDGEQQNSDYQAIRGLLVDTAYITLKTQNFTGQKEKPSKADIIEYKGLFWLIEETQQAFIYTPREKEILYLTLKQIKR